MLLVLGLFGCLTVLELLLWLASSAPMRRIGASILSVPIVLLGTCMVVLNPSLLTGLLLTTSVYRLVNLLRVMRARANEAYLYRVARQASLWIIAAQVIIVVSWVLGQTIGFSSRQWLTIASCGCAAFSLLLAASTVRSLLTTRPPVLDRRELRDAELPTLTVAIPARNETDDLDDCLESLVMSDYPKLEILVLDDCSQNKRTPEIIRSFAHAGVRFLQGTPTPDDNWLAKNYAYQQLYEAASGELLLFCGVDVRFAPDSLRLLVTALQRKHKSMVSIIPRNVIPAVITTRMTTLLQPMRYAWELALPRRLFNRPPVLSTCWLIRHDMLTKAGGFAGVSRSITPESYFARISIRHDGYSFMQSTERMAISSVKSTYDQRSTAVRTLYPRVHRRIELVLLVSLVELVGLLSPFMFVVLGLLHMIPATVFWPAVAALLLLLITYISVVTLTYRAWLARALVLFPFAVVADVFLLNYSMLRYEFFSVVWKDRNVCIPVMHISGNA